MKEDSAADIVIAGAGTVGLTLALALRRSAPDLAVTLVDAGRGDGAPGDDRASAIAAAARRMLRQLGVWEAVAATAQPITGMRITDSRTDDAVRPVFLNFDGAVADGEPFAHMVPNAALGPALRDAALEAGARIEAPAPVEDFSAGDDRVTVRLAEGRLLAARLLVAADGARSRLRALSGIRTTVRDYGQLGLVTTVEHERPHDGVAVEHFLPGGPFAILPLRPAADTNRSSLVWTEPKAVAERLLKAPDDEFQRELAKRFGHQLGSFRAVGRRHGFPLRLMIARDFIRPRFALAGDAAHAIHPVAGQGLNLGLRDVAALAETVVDAARLGLDIGAAQTLERYQRWRRFDTLEMALVTDGLTRLFSNDNPAIRLVRDVGMGLVERLPAIKRRLIGEAAGLGRELPRLLRGEAI